MIEASAKNIQALKELNQPIKYVLLSLLLSNNDVKVAVEIISKVLIRIDNLSAHTSQNDNSFHRINNSEDIRNSSQVLAYSSSGPMTSIASLRKNGKDNGLPSTRSKFRGIVLFIIDFIVITAFYWIMLQLLTISSLTFDDLSTLVVVNAFSYLLLLSTLLPCFAIIITIYWYFSKPDRIPLLLPPPSPSPLPLTGKRIQPGESFKTLLTDIDDLDDLENISEGEEGEESEEEEKDEVSLIYMNMYLYI